MPQTSSTLPDPLRSSTVDAVPNADEILSQLAGDEIDRLLAEADGPIEQAAAPVSSPTSSAKPATKPIATASEASADADLSSQLDDLFNELNREIESVAPAETAATPAEPVAEAPTEAAPVQPEAVPEAPTIAVRNEATAAEQTSSALEQDVLAATQLSNVPEPPQQPQPSQQATASASLIEDHPAEPSLSPLLRPLAWASGLFPESALDWMGKVAILTTINAIVIFAYLLIRGH